MIADLARELVSSGHEVLIVTASREITPPLSVDVSTGLKVCRVYAGKGDHIGRIARAFAELALPFLVWSRAEPEIARFSPEIVVSYSPTIFWGWLVHRIKQRHKSFAYLILRDIFPQWAVDIGVFSKWHPAYWFFRAVEAFQYWIADKIGVQSPSNHAHFAANPQLASKVETLWNWISPPPVAGSDCNNRQRLGLVGKTVFFYGGNMGVAQRMDRLLDLAAALQSNASVHFVLVGEGSERERLQRESEARKLLNMTILEAVTQQQFFEMLCEFDIGIVLLDPHLKTHNIPGKLISYAAAGKPILADVNPHNDVIQLLHDHGAGLISANDDSTFLLNAKLLAENLQVREEIGNNARKMANKLFSVRTTANQILKAQREHFA